MLKLFALFITLTAVYPAEAIIDLPTLKTIKDKITELGVNLDDIVGRCLDYATVPIPSAMILATQYTVSSSTTTICTKTKENAVIPLATSIVPTPNTILASYLQDDGSITYRYLVRQEIIPGLNLIKQYPANLDVSINTDSLLGSFLAAVLKSSDDTMLRMLCPVKPTTSFQGFKPICEFLIKMSKRSCSFSAFSIVTTTGNITSNVSQFENYAVLIGAASPGALKRLDLDKCETFYSN
ncbi:hypothetical protein CHUAL_006220 [Chamberlinius hualienensis]